MTYEWGSKRLLGEKIFSDLTFKDVDLGDSVNVLVSELKISGFQTNSNVMISGCSHTHSFDDVFVGGEVTSVAGGTGGIEELMERDSRCLLTVGREEGQVVLVVANDGQDVGVSGPGLLEPILEGGEATLDSGGQSSTHALLHTLGGVLLHVVEGKRGHLSSHDDLLEVRDRHQGFFKISLSLREFLVDCASVIEQEALGGYVHLISDCRSRIVSSTDLELIIEGLSVLRCLVCFFHLSCGSFFIHVQGVDGLANFDEEKRGCKVRKEDSESHIWYFILLKRPPQLHLNQ